MNIKQMIQQEKSKITDKELFSSSELMMYLEKKANTIHKDFSIANVPTEIFYNRKSEVTAYTENSKYVVNTGHVSIKGDRPEIFYQILGTHFHEIGHRLFTNFTACGMYTENLLRGTFYPSRPVCDVLRKGRLEEMEMYIKDSMQSRLLVKVISLLNNCIEDGRIEEFLMNYCSQYRTQYHGLLMVRDRTFDDIRPLPELLKAVEDGEMLIFEVLIQIILHYARFGEIKGLNYEKHKDEVVIRKFDGIQEALDNCLDAKNSISYYNSLNMLVIHLWPDIFEYIEKIKDKLKKQNEQNQNSGKGNNSSGSQSGSNLIQEVINEITSRSSMIEGVTAASNPANNQNGTGIDNQAVVSVLLARSQQGTAKENASYCGMNSSKDVTQTGQAPPYTRTTKLDPASGTGAIKYRDNYIENSSVSLDLNKLLGNIAAEKADDNLEKIMRKDLEDFRQNIDFTAVHRGVDCMITRHKVTPDTVEAYNKIASPIVKIAKNLAKKTDFFSEDESPMLIHNKYSGKRFNASSVARGDYKNFSREYLLEEAPSVAVAVCIDESGSMSGEKSRAAQQMAIMLYEYCDIMNIPICIYGHTTKYPNGVELFRYSDFYRKDPNDRYRLMNISARRSNRDGYPIRYLKARLEEVEADNKLLFVISDGRPADGTYTGTAANADLQDITRNCDRNGIALISAAIGDSKKAVNAIYGANHYLDISDLSKLPITLTNKIKSLIK